MPRLRLVWEVHSTSHTRAYDTAHSESGAGTPRRPRLLAEAVRPHSLLTGYDTHILKQGRHFQLQDKLGAHPVPGGTQFAVWAPNAETVSVIGDFNGWKPGAHPLEPHGEDSGIWEGLVPQIGVGGLYKYHITARNGLAAQKADPFAFSCEEPPRTASRVWDLAYEWNDGEWMQRRRQSDPLSSPMTVYEVHLGSWRRKPEEGNRFLSYRELAPLLAQYAAEMGFTHVELLPVMEHPFYGSWGYQTLGYFAPTRRYGDPQDLMFLIDTLHQRGVGVILDWVPSHFPDDGHGLVRFDGTALYEHDDPQQSRSPEWNSCLFNLGRNEVRSFLVSSARFWLDRYHADGLRVDAVASMLYLDYGRKAGEWRPNRYGGRENIEAIEFLRTLNAACFHMRPGIVMVAEESTAWPMVTRPDYAGGLGFSLKWKLGWMHDTLSYVSHDPIYRKYYHDELTFSMWYAFYENFVLPLSHDEVVHGKGSLLGRMPGDDWQKFATLRLLFGYQCAHPGKKLLFGGGEFGQWREWDHESSLDWHLLQYPLHQGLQAWVRELNRLCRQEPPLYQLDFDPAGFEWVDVNDRDNSVISFIRRCRCGDELLFVANFTPVVRHYYRVGVRPGRWRRILNSDAVRFGGSGVENPEIIEAQPVPAHGRDHSLELTLPPLAAIILKRT
jgi:1,4-alpha-glucan branching enzyme